MTTTTPEDCIYDVTPEELAKDEPVTYEEGVTADLTPDGTLEFEFPEPRDLTDVKVQAPEDTELVVVPVYEDGTKGKPTPLNSKPEEPEDNPVDEPKVVKVIIKKPDDTPLTPDDITNIEVIACKHGI